MGSFLTGDSPGRTTLVGTEKATKLTSSMKQASYRTPMRRLRRKLSRMLGAAKLNERGFFTEPEPGAVSKEAEQVAGRIRGSTRGAAIFIHGVMPRSGTVYTGEILRLHPGLHAYPNELWEIPFLELTGDILEVQKRFFRAYPQNTGKMGDNDFLPLFGASLMAYLHGFVPDEKRVLVKIPDVQYLSYFHAVFPNEHLLLLLRDGRDVVNSTIRTWPGMDFSEVCRKWALSAKAMLRFQHETMEKDTGVWLTKYEEVVRDPEGFARKACEKFALDSDAFPFEKIREISVRGSSAIKDAGKVTWDASRKPRDFNPVGRWQGWPERQKQVFKKIAGEALVETGYCDNLDW